MISRDYNQMKTKLAFGIGSLLSAIFQPNPILYKFGWKLGWSISDSAKIGRILRLGARSRIDLKTDPILMKSRPGLGSNRGPGAGWREKLSRLSEFSISGGEMKIENERN